MPRCQWCRQESATADVCEWCKRPLAAGWTPAAAVPAATVAAAVPSDRMTFVQNDDAGKNDRILVFAMLGIVVVTAIAFAVNQFTKKESAIPQTPPAVSAPAQPQSATPVDQSPKPAITDPAPPAVTYTPSAPAPVYQTPVQAPMDEQQVDPEEQRVLQQNRKLRFSGEMTDTK